MSFCYFLIANILDVLILTNARKYFIYENVDFINFSFDRSATTNCTLYNL